MVHCGRCGQFILLAIMEELSCPAKLLPKPACSRENVVIGSECGWALVIAVSFVSTSQRRWFPVVFE